MFCLTAVHATDSANNRLHGIKTYQINKTFEDVETCNVVHDYNVSAILLNIDNGLYLECILILNGQMQASKSSEM